MSAHNISKRNLVAATLCYLVVTVVAIWLLALMTAHCPTLECAAKSDAQWRWGWIVATFLYPLFLWISRRSIWKR